jgi:entericidin B
MRALKSQTARHVLPALLLTGAVLSLAACNTMSGMGQDVSAGGKAITKSAEEVQKKM